MEEKKVKNRNNVMNEVIFRIGAILMLVSPFIHLVIDYRNGVVWSSDWDWEDLKQLGMYMVVLVIVYERLFKQD